MIGIIDYGAGNLLSVKNALDHLGYSSKYIKSKNEFEGIEKLILPGVGSFGSCMNNIRDQEMEKPIMDYIKSGRPFLGICIGLQLLFESSEESPDVNGMGVFRGKVRKFLKGKVPQIGWNKINSKIIDILNNQYVYFVNSYYVDPEDTSIISALTNYYIDFTSAISHNNVQGTQFHPEKSGEVGLKFLRSWLES